MGIEKTHEIKYSITINREDLLEMLRNAGYTPPDNCNIELYTNGNTVSLWGNSNNELRIFWTETEG